MRHRLKQQKMYVHVIWKPLRPVLESWFRFSTERNALEETEREKILETSTHVFRGKSEIAIIRTIVTMCLNYRKVVM